MLRPVRLVAIIVAAFSSLIPAPAAPPEAPPPRPALDPSLADWTPRPATGIAEEWEKAIEANWVDGRFRDMDTGPFLNCTMRYPLGKGNELVYKATVVKLGDKGGVVFDRSTMRLAAGWTGGWLTHSDRRFGLMNTPTPKGEMVFANPSGPGWAGPHGKWRDEVATDSRAPLDRKWAKYRGMYLHGDRIVFSYTVGRCEVLDSSAPAVPDGLPLLVRSLEVQDPGGVVDRRSVLCLSSQREEGRTETGFTQIFEGASGKDRIELIGIPDKPLNVNAERHEDGSVILQNNAYIGHFQAQVAYGRGKSSDRDTFSKYLTLAGSRREPQAVHQRRPTPLGRADRHQARPRRRGRAVRGRYAHHPLQEPLQRPLLLHRARSPARWPHRRLHLPRRRVARDGRREGRNLLVAAVRHRALPPARTQGRRRQGGRPGDAANSLASTTSTTTARPTSTSASPTTGTPAAASTATTPASKPTPHGNFYFFKTGDTHTPHGGCLMKVSKDGSKVEVFATGFRHPIGMGMSPTGILTGADQEGNWMPATRIDEYKKGGFYGDMRAHHRKEPPKTFDAPLCWLPREVDNSAGGQVWVPPRTRSVRSRGCRSTSPTAAASRSCCCARSAATGSCRAASRDST